MPPPGVLPPEWSKTPNRRQNDAGATSPGGATTPRTNANLNRPGYATELSTQRTPVNSPRKRPAEGELQNGSSKYIQTSAGKSPHGSSSTRNNTVNRPTDARKVSGPVIDLTGDSVPSSPTTSPAEKETIDLASEVGSIDPSPLQPNGVIDPTGDDELVNISTLQLGESPQDVQTNSSVEGPTPLASNSGMIGHQANTSFLGGAATPLTPRGRSSALGMARSTGGLRSTRARLRPRGLTVWGPATWPVRKQRLSQNTSSQGVRRPTHGSNVPIRDNGPNNRDDISQRAPNQALAGTGLDRAALQLSARDFIKLRTQGLSTQGTHVNNPTSAFPGRAVPSVSVPQVPAVFLFLPYAAD